LFGSLVGRLVIITTAFENVFAPVMVCVVDTSTCSLVAAPADGLNRFTLYAFTSVLAPDVDAEDTVTVVPDIAAENVSWSVPFVETTGPDETYASEPSATTKTSEILAALSESLLPTTT
jgi:hypothetical protein